MSKKLKDYQYKLDDLTKEKQILQDKVTEFFLNLSKDNMALQVKISKMVTSELENLGIY